MTDTPTPRVSDEVRASLRDMSAYCGVSGKLLIELLDDAKDARAQLATLIATIAERDAEIARLKDKIRALDDLCEECGPYVNYYVEEKARAEAAEAKLAERDAEIERLTNIAHGEFAICGTDYALPNDVFHALVDDRLAARNEALEDAAKVADNHEEHQTAAAIRAMKMKEPAP